MSHLAPRGDAPSGDTDSQADGRHRASTHVTVSIGDKILLSIAEAAALLGISERKFRDMVQPWRHEIRTVRLGGRHLVPRVALEEYIIRRLEEQTP